ncbi:MAG: hypothetical protein ACHP85_12415, partial [Burkholderiales bacterium]
LMAGPGLETTPRRPESHDPDGEQPHEGESEEGGPFFLWRFGVGYTFELRERLAVTPNIDLDLVREHGEWATAWVFGVSIGLRF